MLYGADGSLLQKKHLKNNATISKIDYLRGVEYKNGVIEAIYHNDGRVVKTGATTYSYEYWLKDHLGNVRTTFADDNGDGLILGNERRSRNDYYSFGMEWNAVWQSGETYSPGNKYKYNGKELHEEMDLKLYGYGARYYDPCLGRFVSVDPLAEKFPYVTTYNYAENEPIKNIDLWGLQALPNNAINELKSLFQGSASSLYNKVDKVADMISSTKESVTNSIKSNSVELIKSADNCEKACAAIKDGALLATVATAGTASEVTLPLAGVAAGAELFMKGSKATISYISKHKNGVQEAKKNLTSEATSTILDISLKRVPLAGPVSASSDYLIDKASNNFSEAIFSTTVTKTKQN